MDFWSCRHTEFFLKALFHVVNIKKIIKVCFICFNLNLFFWLFLNTWNLFLTLNHLSWNYFFYRGILLIIFMWLYRILWVFTFNFLFMMNIPLIFILIICMLFFLHSFWWLFYLSFLNIFFLNRLIITACLFLTSFLNLFLRNHVFQRKIDMNSINDSWSFSIFINFYEIYLRTEITFFWFYSRINWLRFHEINWGLRPYCSWTWPDNIWYKTSSVYFICLLRCNKNIHILVFLVI